MIAERVAPSLLEPLVHESTLAAGLDQDVWRSLVHEPLGQVIRDRFTDDTVRGVVATDALIGTFADLDSVSLVQNRCFLYHLIGNGTGEWRVPVGGMGAVTDALLKAAVSAGADVRTDALVTSIATGSDDHEVEWRGADGVRTVRCRRVLSGVAPWSLAELLGETPDPATRPVGAQLKINFLLDRLPQLASGVSPELAFAGTLHIAEDFSQLQHAHEHAAAGRVPTTMPGEVYCHSLSDRTIMGDFEGHTLTYFGLHTPANLFEVPGNRDLAVRRAIEALDLHLTEPLESCLAVDADGRPCLEAKVPQDVEGDLQMPGGHIFHGDLAWPWVSDGVPLATPADRWGVATSRNGVLVCGAGAQRGGAVSGLGGHNAARALLEELG